LLLLILLLLLLLSLLLFNTHIEYGIYCELNSENCVTFIIPPCSTKSGPLKHLEKSLLDLIFKYASFHGIKKIKKKISAKLLLQNNINIKNNNNNHHDYNNNNNDVNNKNSNDNDNNYINNVNFLNHKNKNNENYFTSVACECVNLNDLKINKKSNNNNKINIKNKQKLEEPVLLNRISAETVFFFLYFLCFFFFFFYFF
jgi:ATP-dependent Zn protease